MIRHLLFGSLLFGALACSQRPSTPDSILPTEKMESLLWDLLKAEQFAHTYIVSRDSSVVARSKGPVLYEAILKKHGTTDSVFRASLTYYKQHPTLLLPILDSIGQRPDLAPSTLVDASPTNSKDSTTTPTAPATQTGLSPVAPVKPTQKPTFAPKPLAY